MHLSRLNAEWQKNLNFAFYSKDKKILDNLDKDFNDIQYIDSDLDYIV